MLDEDVTSPAFYSPQLSSQPSRQFLELATFKNLCYFTWKFQHLNYFLMKYNVHHMLHFPHTNPHLLWIISIYRHLKNALVVSLSHGSIHMCTQTFQRLRLFFCTTAPHREHVSYLCFPQWQNTVAEVRRHLDVWTEADTYFSGMDGFPSGSSFTLPLPQLTCVEWATYIRTTPVATFPATVNCTRPLGADVGNGKAKPRKWAHLLPRLTSRLHTKSLLSPVSFASRRLAPACPLCLPVYP